MYRMAVVGDSVAWDQGLREETKYSRLVLDRVSTNPDRKNQCSLAYPEPTDFLAFEDCRYASVGHPNEEGAQCFADSVTGAPASACGSAEGGFQRTLDDRRTAKHSFLSRR